MHFGLDQILPSLQSLGLWSYWIIGLGALLEAFFVTGIIVPGTLVVEAGGILVQKGLLDYFDLVWFVALGSFLGGEASYWVGRLGARSLQGQWDPKKWKHYKKAERLFQRHGGVGLIIGRFLGPVSGLIPFAAALSGMGRKRFMIWNAIAAFPYALIQIAFGFFLGDVITRLGPLATRLALFALGVVLGLGLLWYLVWRVERMLPLVLSILKSMLRAIGDNPDARAWARRHPRLAAFTRHRFDTDRFQGLVATLLGVLFVYVLLIWAGTVLDFLMARKIVQIDTRLASLIHVFWTPGLLRAFAHVTALGDWRVVVLIFIGVGAVLTLRRQVSLGLGLGVALIGNVASVAILKMIIHRPRPELAYFVETSGSFPSGHAATSVAFYGMLFYIAWRQRLIGPIGAALLGVTVAFAIGLSRLYLIEHYLSDVLNGYLVGALWLLIGIALAEWWQESRPPQRAGHATLLPGARRKSTALILIVTFASALWVDVTYDKARNIAPPATSIQIVRDIATLFTTGKLPPITESITGSPLAPVSLIFVAKDSAAFADAMQRAGWVLAEKPGISSLAGAAWASWTGQPDATAPVAPYFWQGLPNAFAFEKPGADKSGRKRHHARFWSTGLKTPAGARIFVGTASFDNGMDWGLGWSAAHHIAPDIDAERDLLIGDLKKAGVVARDQFFQLSTPRLGAGGGAAAWVTDGRAVIVWVK